MIEQENLRKPRISVITQGICLVGGWAAGPAGSPFSLRVGGKAAHTKREALFLEGRSPSKPPLE
jgi:hypothetical protein